MNGIISIVCRCGFVGICGVDVRMVARVLLVLVLLVLVLLVIVVLVLVLVIEGCAVEDGGTATILIHKSISAYRSLNTKFLTLL